MPAILSAGHERVITVQRDWLERNLKVVELDNRIAVVQRQLAEAENTEQMARIVTQAIPRALEEQARLIIGETRALRETTDRLVRERNAGVEILKKVEKGPVPETTYEHGLITRQRLITELLARADLTLQIANIDVKVRENETRFLALESQQKSIISAQGMIGGKTAALNLGTELEQVQIWNKGRVNLSIGASERKRLEQNLRDLEALKAEILKSLEPLAKSPLVAAAREPVVVVFVPYENSTRFHERHPLFRCRLWLVWCEQIGVIGPFVDGEVSLPHPLYGRYIRGAFHSVALYKGEQGEQAAQDMLVFSSKPLFF